MSSNIQVVSNIDKYACFFLLIIIQLRPKKLLLAKSEKNKTFSMLLLIKYHNRIFWKSHKERYLSIPLEDFVEGFDMSDRDIIW